MRSGAHFIVSTVSGAMVALCGEVFVPKTIGGSQVGIYGQVCSECEVKGQASLGDHKVGIDIALCVA